MTAIADNAKRVDIQRRCRGKVGVKSLKDTLVVKSKFSIGRKVGPTRRWGDGSCCRVDRRSEKNGGVRSRRRQSLTHKRRVPLR